MFGGKSKILEEGNCSLYLNATEWGGLRVAPALSTQKSGGFRQQCGLKPGFQGSANHKSEEIYVSSQKDGKSGDSAMEREVGPSLGFSPCGTSE